MIPVGRGILTFNTPEEAAAAIGDVQERYAEHAEAASAIAAEYFDSRTVLSSLIDRAMGQRATTAEVSV